MHVAGERNYWEDLLSRRVKLPRAEFRPETVFAGSQSDDTDDTMPCKDTIRKLN